MTNHDSGRSAQKEQSLGRLPLLTVQEERVENDMDITSGSAEDNRDGWQKRWELEGVFQRRLAELVESSNPTGQKTGPSRPYQEHYSVELDKYECHWVLTRYMAGGTRLRLLIEKDYSSDIGIGDHTSFQVRSAGEWFYRDLGNLAVNAWLFAADYWLDCDDDSHREEGEENMREHLCEFPQDFRLEYAQLVGLWGRFRMMVQFRPTIQLTPPVT